MSTEGLHTPETQQRETPTPRDLASEYVVRIGAALMAEGHPHCYLGCGTVREEGTSVQGLGSWSVQGGCQGSGGARVKTILPDTWANQDPLLWSALPPSQTRGREAAV